MKILFIDPMGDKESTGLNIGIAYCATSLLKKGHTVSVLDFVNVRDTDPGEAIKKALFNFKPDVVGISITNMSFNNAKSYIDHVREDFKGKVIVGGPEISALAARSLELIPEADIAVIGEGEDALTFGIKVLT